MNRRSLNDRPAAFLFIFLYGPIDTDLRKDYIRYFSHSSLPPVSPLSVLSIHKGGILSLLVWAEWTQRTQPTAEVNESQSPPQTVGVLNRCNIYREGENKLVENKCSICKQGQHDCPSTLYLMMRKPKQCPPNTFRLLSKQCRTMNCILVFSSERSYFLVGFFHTATTRAYQTTLSTEFPLSTGQVLSFLGKSTGPKQRELGSA